MATKIVQPKVKTSSGFDDLVVQQAQNATNATNAANANNAINAENSNKVNGLEIKEDQNGILLVNNEVVSRKIQLWEGSWGGSTSKPSNLDISSLGISGGDKIELVFDFGLNYIYFIEEMPSLNASKSFYISKPYIGTTSPVSTIEDMGYFIAAGTLNVNTISFLKSQMVVFKTSNSIELSQKAFPILKKINKIVE